jgi:hypothetical protein
MLRLAEGDLEEVVVRGGHTGVELGDAIWAGNVRELWRGQVVVRRAGRYGGLVDRGRRGCGGVRRGASRPVASAGWGGACSLGSGLCVLCGSSGTQEPQRTQRRSRQADQARPCCARGRDGRSQAVARGGSGCVAARWRRQAKRSPRRSATA